MKTNNKIIGSHLYLVDEIDSTNSELLENPDKYEHGSILCAKKQSSGRGRHKREWKSEKGGLYFSVLLKNLENIHNIFPFVLLSALAVTRSISFCLTHGLAIKWPNDIYINHRKLCGILAESSSRGNKHHLVIGLGINVNNAVAHLEDLRHPAVSLKECRGEEVDILHLLHKIANEMNDLYKDFLAGNFKEHLHELNRLLYAKGQEVEIQTPAGLRLITPLEFTPEAKLLCLENGTETELFMGEF
ncbi:MAG: biotin--[acetyl-CoA-carboxylase] ligase [Candidatus Neomarinimicrobiota bacterium]|jgi:BirA family biotin operon repressor/biotin-[acetyl-CoA-carboxylase] ligase